MLIPESRRSQEPGSPIVPDSSPESSGERRDSDLGVTVVKGSGSSARKRSAAGSTPIPLPLPGQMVGAFRLDEAIGAGGMGAVFRALDTQLDRQVALKLLPPDQAVDPEVVQRFYQEGRSAAQLDHENIARVFSIGQDGLFHHIAFEYIEGETLRQRVESGGPLSVGEAVDVSLQIAQALVHASRRGVVHRDIKPSNIILTPQGRAKVVDMGLARRFERGGDHGLTQSGMTLGTFDYISPEQARDPRDVDVRSDLYSLGCTMFHMLTGRPPFPGGTVLQKLIQHQEEPPADVRTLNPDVPPAFSAVIARLMAKERDRRYQGPEHLVRDLLALAASLGLERAPSELESWMLNGHHTWWERHLVWLLPAVGFVVLIAGLGWWGREFSRPPAAVSHPAPETSGRKTSELNITQAPAQAGRSSDSGPESSATEAPVVSAYPRTIPVSSSDNLQEVIATAPRRSVIVLSEDGPYRVGPHAWSARGPSVASEPDLTIRAESGVHPVLRLAEDADDEEGRSLPLLHFVGGHVIIEALEFELEDTGPGEPPCAIQCVDTELVVRGCSFRRPGPADKNDGPMTSVLVQASRSRPHGAERSTAVLADYCHFDPGLTAVRAQGPADVTLRDCTLGSAAPAIVFENTRSELPFPGELRLIHTSILAGPGPVFRFVGGPVRARVDDCVVAPAGRTPAVLVQVEDPRDLNWRGRANLYGPISPYLTTSSKTPGAATIPDFAHWEQSGPEPRELDSVVSESPVWDAPDPLRTLSQDRDNPTRGFLLGPSVAASSDVGARRGPFGAVLENVRLAQRAPAGPALAMSRTGPTPKVEGPTTPRTEAAGRASAGREQASDAQPGSTGSSAGPAGTANSEPMDLPPMPPMPVPAPGQDEIGLANETAAPLTPMPEARRANPPRSVTEPVTTATPARTAQPAASNEDVVRTADQFLAVARGLGDRGGILRIGAGADLELPGVVLTIAAAGRVEILAESRGPRPRLRFRPALTPGDSPADWVSLLSLRSGSLRLHGLDLVVPGSDTLTADRLAAVSLYPGTELVIDDCTVTVAARSASATALAVQASPNAASQNARPGDAATAAVVDVRNSFIRSGGDAVTVAGGVRLALKLEDLMVATDGSLLRAFGAARPTGAEAPRQPAVNVRIGRVSARVKGGLVHLQTTPEEPEMATVDVQTDQSVLSTVTGDHPLFRLEGQHQLERLRDRIRWVGHQVAYHHIKTYRRDEIVQAGGLPRIYDRDDWTRAFLPTDDEPMLADLKFRQQADATVPAWKLVRDDLRLASDSPAASLGPDAQKVPDPPSDEDE